MELQEIFDKAATHLLTQKERSENGDGGGCQYLSVDGLKCAVGAFISKENYHPSIEGLCFDDTKVLIILEKEGVITDKDILEFEEVPDDLHSNKVYLLGQLQFIHDKMSEYRWRDDLIDLARKFNLNTQILNQFQ